MQGATAFGKPGALATRIHDIPTSQKLIDIFTLEQGHIYIDTARVYGGGESEKVRVTSKQTNGNDRLTLTPYQFIAKCDLHNDGKAVVDTK